MPTSEHWRELAREFLDAKRLGDTTAKRLIESLGRRGASWFEPPPTGDFYAAWMNAVQEHNKCETLPRRVVALCELSADLCNVFEREAIEREVRVQRNIEPEVNWGLRASTKEHQSKHPKTEGVVESRLDPGSAAPQALVTAYLAQFQGKIKILDICWAAGQHYCDWKKWKRGGFCAGSAPDRHLRAILSSDKHPHEYRKEPRPSGWR